MRSIGRFLSHPSFFLIRHHLMFVCLNKSSLPESESVLMLKSLLAVNSVRNEITPLTNVIVLPNPESYRCLIGKLNFLTHTKYDIYFAVQYLSQFMQKSCLPYMLYLRQFVQKSCLPYMQTTLHILRYLKGTSECFVFFQLLS